MAKALGVGVNMATKIQTDPWTRYVRTAYKSGIMQ